jgi:hypothetical protein
MLSSPYFFELPGVKIAMMDLRSRCTEFNFFGSLQSALSQAKYGPINLAAGGDQFC